MAQPHEVQDAAHAPSLESQRVLLFRLKFDETVLAGMARLAQTKYDSDASSPLADLAAEQYTFKGFDTAFATLQHPKVDPYNASKVAQKIAKNETELGHRDNALAALDLATRTAKRIPDDMDGSGSKLEYHGIAYGYACLGEGPKAIALVEKLSGNSREWIVMTTAQGFALHGHDDLAFEVIERSREDRSYVYGAVAAAQAKRGDLAAWQQTVKTKIKKDIAGMHVAYLSLAAYYLNQKDAENAQKALLLAADSVQEGVGLGVSHQRSQIIEFAIEKLQFPVLAMGIARIMEPNISAVESCIGIAEALLKTGQKEDALEAITLADKNAEAMGNPNGSLYTWRKPFAQLSVADLYIRVGLPEEADKRIAALRGVLGKDLFDVTQRLAQNGRIDVALQLIPLVEKPITQLVLYGDIIQNLLKQEDEDGKVVDDLPSGENVLRARAILDQAVEVAKRMATQVPSEDHKFLPSHLSSFAETYAKLGDMLASRELFELVSTIEKRTARKKPMTDREKCDLSRSKTRAGDYEGAIDLADHVKDPMYRFNSYVGIAKRLIDIKRSWDAFQVLEKAEGLAQKIDPTRYGKGISSDLEFELATQYYRLVMLSEG